MSCYAPGESVSLSAGRQRDIEKWAHQLLKHSEDDTDMLFEFLCMYVAGSHSYRMWCPVRLLPAILQAAKGCPWIPMNSASRAGTFWEIINDPPDFGSLFKVFLVIKKRSENSFSRNSFIFSDGSI